MRSQFSARPEFLECLLLVACVDVLPACHDAKRVVYETVDAVVPNLVPWAKSVSVVRKWPIHDTALIADSIAAETGDGVQNIGCDESPCIARLVPVSVISLLANMVYHKLGKEMFSHSREVNLRLCTSVTTFFPDQVLMRIHMQAMEGKKGALFAVRTCPEGGLRGIMKGLRLHV